VRQVQHHSGGQPYPRPLRDWQIDEWPICSVLLTPAGTLWAEKAHDRDGRSSWSDMARRMRQIRMQNHIRRWQNTGEQPGDPTSSPNGAPFPDVFGSTLIAGCRAETATASDMCSFVLPSPLCASRLYALPQSAPATT